MIHLFCNLQHDDEAGQLPMCDMTFEIVDTHLHEATGVWTLTFEADADPIEPVGFVAQIPTQGWRHQVSEIEGDEPFESYWGPICLQSLGAKSDRLLALLSDYYGIVENGNADWGVLSRFRQKKSGSSSMNRVFVDAIECLAVGIQCDPSAIAANPVHLKLFFDDGLADGRYAEVFFNIDLAAGFAALNEKDEEYRGDLVHWLSQTGSVQANPHHGDWVS